jgi:hypothetical protein
VVAVLSYLQKREKERKWKQKKQKKRKREKENLLRVSIRSAQHDFLVTKLSRHNKKKKGLSKARISEKEEKEKKKKKKSQIS